MPAEEFTFQTSGRGIGAMLLSNPGNPTGQCIEGEELKAYVRTACESETTIVMDEFYSHYIYDGHDSVDPEDGGVDDDSNWPKTVSSASYIEDVNSDPVLIINGMTNNWRCPGFRVCWIVAPKPIVAILGSAGSYLDGGANAPLQRLSLPLMELDFIRRDTWALQRHFRQKRDFLLAELEKLDIRVKIKPEATFTFGPTCLLSQLLSMIVRSFKKNVSNTWSLLYQVSSLTSIQEAPATCDRVNVFPTFVSATGHQWRILLMA
jgi:aspartate/methionine/tyrosine aminotransferase